MRFAASACIRTTLLDRSRAVASGLVAWCRTMLGTMPVVHVALDPCTTKGSSRAAVLKQGP
jgi:hypothetical protein